MRFAKLFCLGVIVLSVLSCVALAVVRSVGLTRITVTALDEKAEPRDLGIPFVDQEKSLPDYRVTVKTCSGSKVDLGVKLNTSGVDGLQWQLPSPISTADVASVRLDDEDTVVSDAIVEVQFLDDPVTSGNYRFEFETQRSFGVGVQSFFKTPIGIAIAGAFAIAVFILVFSLLA